MDREKQRRRTIGYHVATECSFTKRNYLWHVQGPEHLMVKGETVEVRKRNGEVANVTLGEVIERFMYAGSKVAVAKIDHSNRRDARGQWIEKPRKSRSTRKGVKVNAQSSRVRSKSSSGSDSSSSIRVAGNRGNTKRRMEPTSGEHRPLDSSAGGNGIKSPWEWELDLTTECERDKEGKHKVTKYLPGAEGKKYRACTRCNRYQFV